MKNKFFRIILALLIAILSVPISKVEAIVGPGGAASIISVDAYQYVLENNDMLIIVEYQLIYPPTAYPTESIDQAYIGRLYNSTGAVIANIQPYPDVYFRGYNKGVFAFYFDSVNAPTWNANYTVRLQGNPTLSWTSGVPSYPFNLVAGSGQYHASTDIDDTQTLIATRMRSIAQDIQSSWAVTLVTGVPLRFTDAGVTYFSNAIPNLSTMAPGIYPNILITPMIIVRQANTTYADQLANRWVGVPVLDPLLYQPLFGLSAVAWKGIGWFGLMIVLAFFVSKKLGEDTKPVWFLTFPQAFVGTLIGFVPLTIVGVMASMAYIGVGYIIFWRD